jgi:MFS family permease
MLIGSESCDDRSDHPPNNRPPGSRFETRGRDTIAPVFERHQIRLLLLSVAIVTVSTQPVFLLGAAFFEIGPELGIGPLGLGYLTAGFFLASSVSSLVLGRWVQSVGWRRAMRLNVVVSGALLVLIALFGGSLAGFGVLLVLAAAVYGMANPAANLALATHTDPRWAATVYGIKHAGIPSSTLLAGFAVPVVVVHFGWRAAFVLSAGLAIGVFLLIPKHEGLAPSHYLGAPIRGRPLDRTGMIGLAVAAALGAIAATALGTYLVSAAVDGGFSEAASGVIQFVGSGASIAVRLSAGVLFDRRKAAGYVGLIALMGVGAASFAVLPLTAGATFVAFVLIGYMSGWAWPGLMTYTVVDANRTSAARSTATVQAGIFVGAGGGPLVIGAAVERWGYDAAWWIVAAALIVGTLTVIATRRRVYAPLP